VNVCDIFLKCVMECPDYNFLLYKNKTISYFEINSLANKICKLLKNISGKFIAIECTKYSEYLYASIIACWKLNRCIIPFSKTWSSSHKKYLLTTFNIAVLISDEHQTDYFSGQIIIENSITIIYNSVPHEKTNMYVFPEDIAYILFTSGTSGIPKAVPITHKNLYSYITGINLALPPIKNEILTNLFLPTFDPFFHDLLYSWITFSSLVPIERHDFLKIGDFIDDFNVTIWFSVPSLIKLVFPLYKLSNKLSKLKISLFCGESFTIEDARYWRKLSHLTKIFNLYGPTEATITCCIKEVIDDDSLLMDSIIGKVFGDTRFKIYDSAGAENVAGELLLSGPQVFSGYLSNQLLTGIINIDNQFWYKTGDLVLLNDDNDIVYLGRIDRQVKINGIRFELNALESLIRENCQYTNIYIKESLDSFNRCNGINIFILSPEKDFISSNILKLNLPEAITIRSILYLKEIPLNENGKICYRQLEENTITKYE